MNLTYRRAWQIVAWLLLSLITYLSLMPVPPMPLTFDGVDKLEHSFAYLVLALCFCQAYAQPSRWMVFLIAWGVGIEFAQGWTGYRYFDVWDMVANTTGVLLGGYLVQKTWMGRSFATIERSFLRA